MTGTGSIHDPIRREDNKCAVKDCPEHSTTLRVKNSGVVIGYCAPHLAQAEAFFGA